MMTNNNAYLNAMGIQTWQLKNKNPPLPDPLLPTKAPEEMECDWDDLRASVINCTACGLDKTRTQTVFGIGNRNASLMIIGEAPGFYEDQKGEPFVGRAGQLLNAMLESIGLNRNSVYIANILKCRPPNNRDPLPDEVALCTAFLEKQIALINPTLLLAVGRIASHYLLNNKLSMSQLRGKVYSFKNIPLIVTFHPAYLLRNPTDKKQAFLDLQKVLSFFQGHGYHSE